MIHKDDLLRDFLDTIYNMDLSPTYIDYKICLDYIFTTYYEDDIDVQLDVKDNFKEYYKFYLALCKVAQMYPKNYRPYYR